MATTIKISALPAAVGIDGTNDYLPIVQSGVTNKINRTTLLGITGSPVGTSDTQALTNKTVGVTNTVTLKDTLFTLQDDGDLTKQAQFQLSGITTGTTRTYTLPNASSTLADIATAQTFTNKTLTAPTLTSPSITGTVGGSATYSTPTLSVPVIADFSSAQHNHSSASTGGTLTVIGGGASTALVDQSGLAMDIEGRANTTFNYFVESGCVWSIVSGPTATMTAGKVWINGRRISVSAVASKSFGAGSTDNYVDVDVTGTITYTSVGTNVGTGQTLAANSIRLAIVIMTTGNISSINQGGPAAVAPVISSVTSSVSDNYGNLIYPTKVSVGLIGYRQVTTNQDLTTQVQITGLTCPVIIGSIPRKVKIKAAVPCASIGAAAGATIAIWDGAVGGGTQLSDDEVFMPTLGTANRVIGEVTVLASGSKTYNVSLAASTNTLSTNATSLRIVWMSVELI